jgi:hypothetical protein
MTYHDGHAKRELARRLFESMKPAADWFAAPETTKQEYERHVAHVIADRSALIVAARLDTSTA